jgi:tetratricopeptide (TPR) repeat protein
VERVLCPVTVGREDEEGRLVEALRAARQGQSQVVVLAGDAGLGKTRLAGDLAQTARQGGVATLWGSCSEAPLSLPYLPFLEAIGNHLAEIEVSNLRALLGGGHHELARLFPGLGMEAPPEDPSNDLQRKVQLFEGVLSLLRVFSEPGGLLVVLESMQWADAASRELLEYLVRRQRGARVMLLVTCRLDQLDRRDPFAVMIESWRRGRTAELIELAPLPVEGVAEMLRAMFSVDTVGAEECDLLHERSEGNPFALEEILKDALDRGVVSRQEVADRSTWRHLQVSRLRLPRSVRDSVLSRLEGLPEESAHVLRCASVLGRSFDYSLLFAISGREPRVVQETLRACVRQQLLEEEAQRKGFFQFRHSLTRAAVYEDLLAPHREELHAAAAEALRQLPGTPAVDLYHHLMAARREREAVPLALEAAEHAYRTHAYGEAAELYERVLPLIEEPRRRAELYCRAGMALLLQGDPARAERHLREGVQALERLGLGRAAAGYRIWLGRCYWERSRPDAARTEYEAARDRLDEDGPSEELALAYVRLAGLAAFQLNGLRAIEMARRAVEIGAEAGADGPRIWAYTFLGLGNVQLGRAGEGLEYLDLSYREATAAGLDVIAVNALYNAVIACVQVLRPLEALPRLEALKATRVGSMVQALRAEGFVNLWGLGQPANALPAFEEALELARQGAASSHVKWLEIQLALTLAQLDRLEMARELLPARSDSLEGQDRANLLYAEMRIAIDGGRSDDALDAAEKVLVTEHWPLRTRLYLGDLALEVLVAAGRLDEARPLPEAALAAGADLPSPYLRRMQGRLHLAGGRREAAVQQLRAAAGLWRERGVRQEEGRTRLVLAEALAAGGDLESAQAELRAAFRSAEQRGAALEARLAREALARLGSRAVTVDHVRDALELMRSGDTAPAPLARLLGLEQDPGGVQLGQLLAVQVELMANSATGREREAGQLLREYYLKRVGSQEVVAGRLHLTRATFYRRLHLGWALLGERLSAAG